MLKLRNIETYYESIYALKGLSLDVQRGDITCLLGPNGAGKSTVLKTVMGLVEPEKGTIDFIGKRIEKASPQKMLGMGMSLVPEGREIFYDLTVKENLWMGGFLRKDKENLRQDWQKVIDYFPELKNRMSQTAGTLSGGEQQMLAIQRALMSRPKLLLFDEPSLGLAPLLTERIFEVIKTINEEEVTVLLVEQNAKMAFSVSDFGYIIENGRIVLDGLVEHLLEDEDIKEFYLGIKETVRGTKRWKKRKRWR
jgi:branched-chain amino acid transport system ATP-binding protein